MRALAIAFALLASGSAAAIAAQECPASSPAQMDAIVQAIVAAPGCGPAYRIMEACSFGSSADVQTGAAVVEKCEADIPPRLKPAFERERADCIAKYARQDGTMYRSMAAFCVAKAAAEHAKRGGGASR